MFLNLIFNDNFHFNNCYIYLENIKHFVCMLKKIKNWISKNIIYLSYIKVTIYFEPLSVIYINSHISEWTILSRSLPCIHFSLRNFSLCYLPNNKLYLEINRVFV
jgi:hypothetical protein